MLLLYWAMYLMSKKIKPVSASDIPLSRGSDIPKLITGLFVCEKKLITQNIN